MSLREKDGGGGDKSPKNSKDTYELARLVLGVFLTATLCSHQRCVRWGSAGIQPSHMFRGVGVTRVSC